MPLVGAFTITEIRKDGGEPATFEWTSTRRPSNNLINPFTGQPEGGAKAVPVQPWTQGGVLRTVRTDYPGATTPSEQVLGPNHNDQTLNGRWDDRYNYPGYARQERLRFEEMCRRGNTVEFGFQDTTYRGLIKEWSFDFLRDWYIRYRFTVSVHDRPGEVNLQNRSPSTTKSAPEAADGIRVVVSSLQDVLEELDGAVEGDLADNVRADVVDITDKQNRLLSTLDQRELQARVGPSGSSPFGRLATQFRSISNASFTMVERLIQTRADVELGVKNAINTLRFEDTFRTMRYFGRVLVGEGNKAAKEMDERDKPDAVRLYRPFQGESLYAISRRFYGNPFSWRLIADRNALSVLKLTGDELLVIPERGRG